MSEQTSAPEKKKSGPLPALGTILIIGYGGYQVYQYFNPQLPLCDAGEVKETLARIFRENAKVDTTEIKPGAFTHLVEESFDPEAELRTCAAKFTLHGKEAPLNYTLNWQDRGEHVFSLRTMSAEPGTPHALFLINPLPLCDDANVQTSLNEIFAHVGQETRGELTGISAITQTGFDARQERRVCNGTLNSADGGTEVFFYRVTWSDKARAHFYVEIIDAPAHDSAI